MQITEFTPGCLVDLAGGKPQILAAAASFRPGSPEWQSRILAEIVEKARGPLTQLLVTALGGQISLFLMMHGARPSSDPFEWDGNFGGQLYEFMEPNFKFAFSGAHDIDKAAQEWLGEACPAPEALVDREFLASFCDMFASAIIDGVYRINPKPGQLLAMLGITKTDACDKDWPEPAAAVAAATPESLAEAGPPKSKRGRKKKDRGAEANITLDTRYLKKVSESSSYTPKMLSAVLGLTPISLKKAIEGETPGVSASTENAERLAAELRRKGEELIALASKLAATLGMLALERQMSASAGA